MLFFFLRGMIQEEKVRQFKSSNRETWRVILVSVS